jgi:hypothetical protein
MTPDEKKFVLEQLQAYVGAKVQLDEKSQCYSIEYPSGDVAYTKGVDFAGREVSEAEFRKFIQRDQANRARMKKEAK